MKLNTDEKSRLEGYYRRSDYTKSRYQDSWMRNYSIIRSISISKIIQKQVSPNKLSLLDIGCGTGVLLKQLNSIKSNDYNLTGLDFSKDMLKSTCLNSKELETINLVHGSAFSTPFPENHFDIVLCTRFIHQYNDQLKSELIKEMRRIVKPGGLIIVEFYSYFKGLIKYIYESIIMPEKFSSQKDKEDFFLHYVGKRKLYNLLQPEFEIVPVVIPMHSVLTKILGVRGFNKFNNLIKNLGGQFIFSEYLAIFSK